MTGQLQASGEEISYLELATMPSAPFWARRQTRAALHSWQFWPETIDTAELLVSELVTNAVRYSSPEAPHQADKIARISLTLRHIEDRLIIEVSDPDPRPPMLAEPELEADGGRGLMLVQTLSKEWNYYLLPSGGKVVYCILSDTELTAT
jgi:anti-sigma regulatory factor (Ser/Thr protein kinase)